jgi:transposase
LGSGEVWKAQLAGSPVAAIEWLRTLPGAVRAVYEAGPTGFGLARAARGGGHRDDGLRAGRDPASAR